MSNNATAAGGGSILGMISLMIQHVEIQSVFEVFAYGVIGGIAGIIGKNIAVWAIKKIKQLLKIENKHGKQK